MFRESGAILTQYTTDNGEWQKWRIHAILLFRAKFSKTISKVPAWNQIKLNKRETLFVSTVTQSKL